MIELHRPTRYDPQRPQWSHASPASCPPAVASTQTGALPVQREERICFGLEHSGKGRAVGFLAWHSR